MSLAITHPSSMKTQDGATHAGVPRPNAFDVSVVYQDQLILRKGSGVITFRDGATELTLFGFGKDKLPETGTVVKIWGVSEEYGEFLLPSAQCISHGEGILKGSATFIQVNAPALGAAVGISRYNAEASVASEYGLMVLKNARAVIAFNLGATQITVFGFGEDNLPRTGAVMKIWGVSQDQGPYFLPKAKCISHGEGILKGSATFVQMIVGPTSQ